MVLKIFNFKKMSFIAIISVVAIISGCSSTPKTQQQLDTAFLKKNSKAVKTRNTKVSNVDNACSILKENPDWLKAARRTSLVYGVPIHTQLAFVRHESNYVKKARPLNKNRKSIFDKKYASTAYGYAQVLDGTWDEFKTTFNNKRLKRTNFGHSVEFIGWYNKRHINTGIIHKDNVAHLYLAYHEGLGGYKKKTFLKKPWLVNYSRAVHATSDKYKHQINACNLKMK